MGVQRAAIMLQITEKDKSMQLDMFEKLGLVGVTRTKSVMRLLRFSADGEFNSRVTYAQWLAWFTPLSRSVNGGGL